MNSKYGTFLADNAYEREKLKLDFNTIDIFSEIDLTMIQYQNSFYIKPHHDDATSQIIS